MAYLGRHSAMPPRVVHLFLTKNLHAQCIDVWCEAFCCRHINFKTVFQSASNTPFSCKKMKKKFWRKGTFFLRGSIAQLPMPQPPTGGGYPPRRLRCTDPRSFGAQPLVPPFQNPKYATDYGSLFTLRQVRSLVAQSTRI